MPIFLHNPHSVLATLTVRPQDVFEIRLQKGPLGEAWEAVRREAESIGITINEPQVSSRKPMRGSGRTSATEAVVKQKGPIPIANLIPPDVTEGLYLALDGVQDPQNLGSIFRSAAFFNVRGIILTRDRAAPVSQTVYDVSSGGVERIPFSQETNLAQALDTAKERGLWILGSSEHADKPVTQIAIDRPWLLVIGNEESGLRRLTLERCDEVCSIPSAGAVTSLNVAVAAGILLSTLSQ